MPKKLPETNPFVQPAAGFAVHAVWKLEKLPIGTVETGSTTGNVQYRAYRLEVDDRAQVYTDTLLNFFPGLSAAAKDMFMYIAARLGYSNDYIELKEDKYCTTMNVGRSTFFNARKELTNRVIVERQDRKNTYWVNPAYLFKGSRMDKYPDAVVMDNTHPFEKLNGS